MRKLIWLLLVSACLAQSTPNLNFNIPSIGTQNYAPLINGNFVSLDALLSGTTTIPAIKVTGLNVTGTVTLPASFLSGNGSRVATASTSLGAAGSLWCNDGNGNATSLGCTSGGGAGGNSVITNPASGLNQTVSQPVGTNFAANIFNKVMYAALYSDASGGINAAFAGCIGGVSCLVYAPLGTTSACNISVPTNGKLVGFGKGNTILQCGTANAPVISNVGTAAEVRDLTVQHSLSPTSGGDGVITTGDRIVLRNIESRNNWNSYNLGAVSFAEAWALIGEYSNNDCLLFNAASGSTMQWIIHGGLFEQCAGWGVDMNTTALSFTGPTFTDGYQVFGNHLGGMRFAASLGFRISDIFIGGDGVLSQNNGDNLFFDNRGRNVRVENTYNEQSGQNSVGYGFNHATTDTPSNAGYGVRFTANCDNTNPPLVAGNQFWETSDAAMMSQCAGAQFNNNTVFDAGFGHASGATALRTGVSIQANDITVSGLFCSQDGSGHTVSCLDVSNSADKPNVMGVHCGANLAETSCVTTTTFPTNGFREFLGPALLIQNNIAASGSCINGSIWTRTDATGGWYLCVNGSWVSK